MIKMGKRESAIAFSLIRKLHYFAKMICLFNTNGKWSVLLKCAKKVCVCTPDLKLIIMELRN